MRITLLTTGSRGDVQPFLALALGLKNAGHEPVLATNDPFGPFVESHGIPFHFLGGDVRALLETGEGRKLLSAGGSPLRVFRQLARLAGPLVVESLREGVRACERAELIICSSASYFGGEALHEALGIPIVYGSLQPMAPTRHAPAIMAPALPGWLQWAGRYGYHSLTHAVGMRIFAAMFAESINRGRREVLGLGPRPRGIPRDLFRSGPPFLYAYSPHVVARPPDWPEGHQTTGYWFLDAAADWQPPPRLVEFLQAGPPPVSIGFGSMSEERPEDLARLVVKAVRQAGQRAIILTGWGSLAADVAGEELSTGDDVYFGEAIPHDWLMPRVAAVVHHGGAGTTSAGLRAGRPTVIVPYMADQPFWGRQVASLGVGPAAVPRKRLTATRLARAIREGVESHSIREQAAQLGEKIRGESGIANAIHRLEQFVNESPR